MSSIVTPADLLLPYGCDPARWSVIACDQYTADPAYWQAVEALVGDAPSTLRLTLPEILLGTEREAAHAAGIAAAAREYRRRGLLREYRNSFVCMVRTMPDGTEQRGIVGKVDLLAYDYAPDSVSPIRATEGTILERIPPRMRIRRASELECPHIVLLADDRSGTLFAPTFAALQGREPLYDFTLMQQGGALRGWLLSGEDAAALQQRLDRFAEACLAADPACPVYAVGDGNHSLATARACYEALRTELPQEEWENHPARYALVQITDLHDPSMHFEAIHRTLFSVEPAQLLELLCRETGAALRRDLPWERRADTVAFACGEDRGVLLLPPNGEPAVAVLQRALDRLLPQLPGAVLDYIHGEAAALSLAARAHTLSLLLPPMEKSGLFSAVARCGVLPRKTFSTGAADEKRFYLECRAIVPLR